MYFGGELKSEEKLWARNSISPSSFMLRCSELTSSSSIGLVFIALVGFRILGRSTRTKVESASTSHGSEIPSLPFFGSNSPKVSEAASLVP